MSFDRQDGGRRGIVVSDLHLFARRSRGATRFGDIQDKLRTVDVLVLNGDVFDFRWSTFGKLHQTLPRAINWLHSLVADLSSCEIHYITGNHDCAPAFQEELSRLARSLQRFRWHEYFLQLGPTLFLHGDCAHYEMDQRGLELYRAAWQQDRRWSTASAIAYEWMDWLGITRLVHEWHFPRQRTIERIASYLDYACPDWRAQTRDCYFGHTHLPFTKHEHEGILFHNTGSAIHDQEFGPVFFAVPNQSI